MLNKYPLWKYLLIIAVLALGLVYSAPNLYPDDPSIQITGTSTALRIDEATVDKAAQALQAAGITVKASEITERGGLLRLTQLADQLPAKDIVRRVLGDEYVVALNLAPTTPDWLRSIGASPMKLGLDLSGGVHFLLEVDMDKAVDARLKVYEGEVKSLLRKERVRYRSLAGGDNSFQLGFTDSESLTKAQSLIRRNFNDFEVTSSVRNQLQVLNVALTAATLADIREYSIKQNLTTVRNRVNELGVAEPVIQRQGSNRIVVQLPGVQDTARAKDILGATATLEFRLVDEASPPFLEAPPARVAPGTQVFPRREGGYVVLKRDVIITGDFITDASSGIDSQTGGAQVNIRLNSAGGNIMNRETRNAVGKFMAVVFIENKVETRMVDGQPQKIRTRTEEVINTARIQEALGSSFRITGLDSTHEARNLALLLRAGSLAAPLEIVEERTVGPSLGKANIEMGFKAAAIGVAMVMIFMMAYYKVFGIFASVAVIVNLILMVAALSLLQATLTLPGIAGIALTIGMAVDANVLIYERIREELRNGVSPQQAIHAGYHRAFASITDSQLTTLIAGIALFAFGSGPVRGFAVTLSIGILTSLFTSIMCSRALANLVYGGRRVRKLYV